MRHYTFGVTAACVARREQFPFPDARSWRTGAQLTPPPSTRTYTAIPLGKEFLRRGAVPHLAGSSEAAHFTTPTSPSASPRATAGSSTSALATSDSAPSRLLSQPKQQESLRNFLQCRTTSRAPALVYTTSAAAAELRVRESLRPASRVACVRVPRLLIFGGDVVSVTALEALHARMRCVVAEALRCSRRGTPHLRQHDRCPPSSSSADSADDLSAAEAEAEVDAFVREHITVVCPALPKSMSPEEAARKFTRQYPVARYCVDHGLPIIPVDHPKSLTRSALLREMVSTVQSAAEPSPDSAATPTARAHRSPKAAPFLSHLPSHVFSPTHHGRNRSAAAAAVPSPATNGATQKPTKHSTAVEEAAAPHTWTALGRSLDDYDLAVVVSFRYFLPKHLLRVLPPVINMHPSLLPRYRGASPIFSALRRNETVGGVSIVQMKPEQKAMDSGSILWQCEVPMTPDMDIRLYFPLVTQIGAAGLCDLIFGEAPCTNPSSTRSSAGFATSAGVAATALTAAACVGAAVALHAMPPSTAHTLLLQHAAPLVSSTIAAAAVGTAVHAAALHRDAVRQDARDAVSEGSLAGSGAETEKKQSNVRHGSGGGNGAVPPWVALRRSSLMPVVHRAGGHASLLSLQRERERLAPYVDLPELSVFSSIITARSREMDRRGRSSDDRVGDANGKDTADPTECGGKDESGARPCRHWMTLCRNSTHITPEAVHEASKAHRALFFQNLESGGLNGTKGKNAPHNKKQVSPAAAAELEVSTAMKCAEVFPESVLSPYCDWPDSFTYSWKFAQVQEYRTFVHFTDDPFHAPLLPKDAAVLRFSAFTAMEAFGVWRAFVGGDYFQPSTNATLDKGGSPVRNQLVHRGVRRLLRERAKLQHKRKKTPPSSANTEAAVVATGDEGETPVGIVVGKHVDLDVFNPAGLQLLVDAENLLRTPCTFTQVTNPTLAPPCVLAELTEVERGGDRCCGDRPAAPLSGRRVRFYRAPPAIFRSLLATRASAADADADAATAAHKREAESRRRGRRCCAGCPSENTGGSRSDAAARTDGKLHARGRVKAVNDDDDSGVTKSATTQQPDEPAEDEEAPEGYVPDVIHAAPPTEHRWHIPPGTAYFPESDESYGAIKCKDGWFLWKEAHMKWANKAQPAVLIRKGLAMKTGVLYVGLFSEYS